MKKSEILKFFGDRVITYHKIEDCDILVIYVEEVTWKDLSPKIVKEIIDIQPWDNNSVRVSFDCNIWD